KKLKYFPRLPVSIYELGNQAKVNKWLKEKNLKAFTFMPPKNNPLEIDIIIEESLKFDAIAKNRVLKKISNVTIPVVSIVDLLKMKRRAGRANDLQDIEALLSIKAIV
ncbi:MAG: hypothetical protein AAB588_06500, partial [Patescibacteria group bacterium]